MQHSGERPWREPDCADCLRLPGSPHLERYPKNGFQDSGDWGSREYGLWVAQVRLCVCLAGRPAAPALQVKGLRTRAGQVPAWGQCLGTLKGSALPPSASYPSPGHPPPQQARRGGLCTCPEASRDDREEVPEEQINLSSRAGQAPLSLTASSSTGCTAGAGETPGPRAPAATRELCQRK